MLQAYTPNQQTLWNIAASENTCAARPRPPLDFQWKSIFDRQIAEYVAQTKAGAAGEYLHLPLFGSSTARAGHPSTQYHNIS
jgi:hypothetical protein